MQPPLFDDTAPALPGLRLRCEFIDRAEEAALIDWIVAQPLQHAEYKGWRARRRVLGYGGRFDYALNRLQPAPPPPERLHALRERVAAWVGDGVTAAEFAHVLLAEYAPGTPLGWHRDVPDFERVVGLSLGGAARMRFRRWPPAAGRQRDKPLELPLPPRSIYLLSGEARWRWQHAVAPVAAARWSITFRTLCGRAQVRP